MSQAKSTQSDCKHCDETFDIGYKRGYCSEDCYWSFQGDRALNLLRHDHRLCTCGRKLKEVSPPTDDWKHAKGAALQVALDNGGTLTRENGQQTLDLTSVRDVRPIAVDSVIGFQFRTPNAVNVEKELPGAHKHSRIIRTGIGCKCGNTDPSSRIEELQVAELATVLSNYVHIYKELHNEGQLDQRIDKDEFFTQFQESGGKLCYALGKALFD